MMDAVLERTLSVLVDSITLWMEIHLVCVFICKYMFTLAIRDNELSHYCQSELLREWSFFPRVYFISFLFLFSNQAIIKE